MSGFHQNRASAVPGWFMIAVWVLWVVDLILITVGSVMLPLQHHLPWQSSSVSHFLAYMGIGLLPMLVRPGWRGTLFLFVTVSILGGLMEWIQTFMPGRYGTISDALINMVGLATGILIGFLLEKLVSPLLARMGLQDRTAP